MRLLFAVSSLLGLLSGCAPASRNLGWEFEFGTPTLADRAQVVRGRILSGGCASGTVLYEDEVARGETPSMPTALSAGRYGFEGLARDTECIEFARGCVEVDVPRDEGDVVVVRLLASSETTACSAALCSAGRCGAFDAGLDAPATDAAADAPGLDASTDVGVDAPGLDAPGLDAPADAGVPRVVSSYAVGTAFACAITTDGTLYCWGSNLAGQLGLGVSGPGTRRLLPTQVETGTTWTMLGIGDEHVCGTLGTDLYCWGDNMDGQIVTGDMTSRSMPTRAAGAVVGPYDVIDGASLGDQTCTLRPGGTLECVGQNDYGQLGLGDNVNHLTFGAWPGTYRSLGAGHHFTCGVRTDGALACTGRNEMGQLGLGAGGVNQNVPTLVGAGIDWTSVTAGDTHACGLRGTGELWCWGEGTSGRLGTGATTALDTPTRIGADADWTVVSAGVGHTCGLRAGQLWCWGANDSGQVGVDTAGAPVLTPMRVGTSTDWTSVRAGGAFTCGTRGAALYCWGDNALGALGLGDITPRSAPTLVTIR